ncbi:hypothetical protein IGI04_003088 [Brassica rapa subsp. trilocularis]|uniref:Cysteine-rich transmembrane CYSTM domain-containing protein n=1 Tax=Brassica rapa subsp. trilocularis TaxID=1813537 RepID=A0ABQ7NZF0_BRACM|nr:hypothetical protein IGI04_003088 [Brassica rapa subsp. trilocularis]
MGQAAEQARSKRQRANGPSDGQIKMDSHGTSYGECEERDSIDCCSSSSHMGADRLSDMIHTPLNSFTPDSLHRVFSDYNPLLIRIHIPICVDPCRKDLCSGDHLHLCKRHHLPSPPYESDVVRNGENEMESNIVSDRGIEMKSVTEKSSIDTKQVNKMEHFYISSAAVVEKPPQGPYTSPPPIGYPTRDAMLSDPPPPAVETKSKGDGCAAICCCCVLDACF